MDKKYILSLPNANEFNNYVNSALIKKEINKDEWYELNNLYFTKLYLSSDNPRGQSGHGGDEYHYIFSHLPIMEAIYKNGTFLDVGCANGYLMEMIHKWGLGIGFKLEMYGVEISEGLLKLAKERLPKWNDRFIQGNVNYWKPVKKFDYIHVGGLGHVPEEDKPKYFLHLLENYIADEGRMILGPYWYENDNIINNMDLDNRYSSEKIVSELGIKPSGFIIKTHYNKPNIFRKALFFDKKNI